MLYVELTQRGRETQIFLNGYLHKERFENELENCFLKQKEQMNALLEKGEYLTTDKIYIIEAPTRVISKSDVSLWVQEAKRGDKLIMHTDASCEIIRRSIFNVIRGIMRFCAQRLQYQY